MTRPTERCPHTGKLMHPTHESAVAAMKGHRHAAEMTGKTEDGCLHPYRCRFCDGWHLGNDSRAKSPTPYKRTRDNWRSDLDDLDTTGA